MLEVPATITITIPCTTSTGQVVNITPVSRSALAPLPVVVRCGGGAVAGYGILCVRSLIGPRVFCFLDSSEVEVHCFRALAGNWVGLQSVRAGVLCVSLFFKLLDVHCLCLFCVLAFPVRVFRDRILLCRDHGAKAKAKLVHWSDTYSYLPARPPPRT